MTLLDPGLAPSFVDRLADHGERVALVTPDGPLRYAELDARVQAIADQLAGGRRLVMIEAANRVGPVIAYLGALRAGCPVLLVPAGDAEAAESLTARYDPDVVALAGTSGDDPAVLHRREQTRHVLHPDLALLLATSGTTGSPKLVRLSLRNVQSNAAAIAQFLGITADDRAVTTLPMQYCYGLSVLHSHLHAGASVALTELSVVDRCFWELVADADATNFAGVPHTFDLLDRVGFASMSLPALRFVTQAGGRLHPEAVRRWAAVGRARGWRLFVMYGQTEATARMAYLPPALAHDHPHAIGVPIPGGELDIADADADGVGELVYRGPNVMLGYAEGAADLARGAELECLRTGDLARRSDAGLYEIVGRRSRFVKPFGLRIDLDAVERFLAEDGITAVCTGDDAALVVAVEDARVVDRAAALVDRRLGLPRSCVVVAAVGEIPRLANGKPDHAAVRRLATVPPAPPADTPGDEAVRTVFEATLGVRPSDADTFVSLGGDSLSYVEVATRLEQVLGDLPRDWHTTPIGSLEPGRAARRFVARADTSVVLRAAAIVLIVGTHVGLWRVTGGAHTLLAVAGYNFARFQLGTRTVAATIARIAVPSVCWIAIVAAASDRYGWPNVLLVNGFVEGAGHHRGYWFVESLVQILAVVGLVFAPARIRRIERRAPFAVALVALGVGLVFRYDLVDVTVTTRVSRVHEVFWLFALGWAAARATTRGRRAVVTVLAVVTLPGYFGTSQREVIVAVGVALLVWAATVPVPRVAQRTVTFVAAASLYIYLTHFQLYPPLDRTAGAVAAVVGCTAAGVGVWLLLRRPALRRSGSSERGLTRDPG